MPRTTKSSSTDNISEKDSAKVSKAKSTAKVKKSTPPQKASDVPAKKTGSTANKGSQTLSSESQESVAKNIPVWDSWNKRHTITLVDAICTVHNIVGNKRVLEKLQKGRDPRTKGFNTHLKTLKDWVRNEPDVLPVEDRHSGVKVTNGTSILLVPFIQWVEETKPFPGLDIPQEFFELTPPVPRSAEVKTTYKAPAKVKKEESSSGEHDEVLHKKWAKLLIALAMKDYGLQPKLPAKELMAHSRGKKDAGLYAPLSEFCKDHGIDQLSQSVVKEAFEGALEFLGEDFVDRLKRHAEGKERNASLKKVVQTSA
ncbi:hypothetical protein [Comamonas testosteroni]|uniref:hypothetical protein n=1 Tax=Comamonas testosteroni TaxID=285 RepID=UPI0026F15DD9|nr:hypothetical protein [Comamonas testosteroni]